MQPFMENLPAGIDHLLRRAKTPEEEVIIQVATDMDGQDRFGERWLAVTDRHLFFFGPDGAGGTVQLPVEEVEEVRVEPLVGGGRLEVEPRNDEAVHLYYSSSLAPKFSEVAEGIKRLSKGGDPGLATELERSRCPRCSRVLPERDGICPACVRKLDTLRRLLGYMRPYRLKVALLLATTAISTLLGLVPPLITRHIVDDVLTPRANFDLLVWLVAGLLSIGLLSWAADVARKWLGTWVGLRTTENMRAHLYRSLQYLPLRFYDRRTVGSLISRMNNDSDLVEEYLIFDIPFIVSNAMMLAGILGLLFYMNWELTLYVLLPVAPIAVGGGLVWKRMESHWRRWSVKWSQLSSHLNESIRGIRIVKAFSQERREGERFDRRSDELRRVMVSAERNWVVFSMVTNFFMSFGVFFVWYIGGGQILDGELTLGALMAFITYIWMLYQPLKWFGDFYGFMMRAYAGAERIFEVMDTRLEPVADPHAVAMPRLAGRLTFEQATFGYDSGKPVLNDVDLEIEPGEMIGLVGKSGAGKSTMISLVCRFYDLTRGCLRVDGVDIRRIRLEDLRGKIGLVAQEPFLFHGTIAENISYGKPGASFEEVVRAARAANAHEFIVTKPDGYDMKVGEKGSKLAGGEKQRLAIARAILHDPRILILDEATSSLDTPTEKKIQEAIGRLVRGRTTLAIAHRLSTLRSADRLVVLDEGRVAEVGTHEELMAREGIFNNLVKTQQQTSEVMAVGGGKE